MFQKDFFLVWDKSKLGRDRETGQISVVPEDRGHGSGDILYQSVPSVGARPHAIRQTTDNRGKQLW